LGHSMILKTMSLAEPREGHPNSVYPWMKMARTGLYRHVPRLTMKR
jgi:hypothetical protein